MNPTELLIETRRFSEVQDAIEHIRRSVFIEEQQVPEELEWDGLDDQATHLLASVAGQPVATARLLDDGHIGRMAVLPDWRRQEIGTALLSRLIELGRQRHLPRLFLNAQITAMVFYSRAGFVAEGEPFMDAGIPHKRMVLELDRID